jgi:hypothetical protein
MKTKMPGRPNPGNPLILMQLVKTICLAKLQFYPRVVIKPWRLDVPPHPNQLELMQKNHLNVYCSSAGLLVTFLFYHIC